MTFEAVWLNHQEWLHTPVTPAPGRRRQKAHLSSGVQGQPGEHSETLSQKSKVKLFSLPWGPFLWKDKTRCLGTEPRSCREDQGSGYCPGLAEGGRSCLEPQPDPPPRPPLGPGAPGHPDEAGVPPASLSQPGRWPGQRFQQLWGRRGALGASGGRPRCPQHLRDGVVSHSDWPDPRLSMTFG